MLVVAVLWGLTFIFDFLRSPALLDSEQQAIIESFQQQESSRQKAPKRVLVGRVETIAIDRVTGRLDRVQIAAWIRNESNVGTAARVLSISLRDRKREPLFLAWPSTGGQLSDLETKLKQQRLGYGYRIHGTLPLIVEVPMVNVDTSFASITIADDFDQAIVLQF